ncbi:MAG: FG-GAP repeat protein [Planctomycetota bacterium]
MIKIAITLCLLCIPLSAESKPAAPKGLSDFDWTSIRAAYDAERHAARPVHGGFCFRNPGQQWNTQFDGRGFVTKPEGANWSWGLALQSYGIEGHEQTVSKTTNIVADGQRILYPWDSNLTEWYKNDTRGLEHGYTVQSRPAQTPGLLVFNLAVLGDLHPDVQSGGRDVRFVNNASATVVNYSGLTVIDANGTRLPARFEATKNSLVLYVDDVGARYPITIDPIAQQAYLKASNVGAFDAFGWSVAVSGNTAVVGAYAEDSNATGVDGNQTNEGAASSGAAYVFVRNGTNWVQQAYLKASNTGAGDLFGYSVAVSGNTIIIGAFQEGSNATGVNGDGSNNGMLGSGAAYVFIRSGSTWSQQAYLKASNTGAGDSFGFSVAASGDTVAIGAYLEASSAFGVNGNQSSNSASGAGAVYVFVRSGTTWSQQAYLKASNTGPTDQFGRSVSVSQDTVVVGAYQEDSSATTINGDQSNNSSPDAGAAYVFVRSGTTWSQQAYLKASNTGANDQFGRSLSISGDTIVVGAYLEDSNAVGANGNQNDNSAADSGAAYVFVRVGSVWSQHSYLKASNTEATDSFGYSVSVSGNIVVVAAVSFTVSGGEDSDSTGVNGDQSNNNAEGAGAVYVFQRIGATWSQQAYLKASNTEAHDNFGIAVAVEGDVVVVGAHREEVEPTTLDSGAIYIFDLDNNPGSVSYGTGTPGCAGTHTLGLTHAPTINSPVFAITCDNAPPLSLGLAIITDSQDLAGSDPFGLGVLLHADLILPTEVITLDFYSDGTGYSETAGATIPNNPTIVGNIYYACALWAWPTSTCTLPGFNPYNLSTSRGLAITILVP